MALRYKTKLPFAFRESDIQAFLSVVGAFKQKVQRKRGLPVPGSPSTKYNRSGSKPPHSTSSSPGMPVETRSSFIGGKSLFFGCPDRTASSPSETGRSHPINHPKPARFPNRCRPLEASCERRPGLATSSPAKRQTPAGTHSTLRVMGLDSPLDSLRCLVPRGRKSPTAVPAEGRCSIIKRTSSCGRPDGRP
jgi:hypothetical protein